MSTDAPVPTTVPVDPPPPTEAQRAIRALVLGAALGTALALLGNRASSRRA